MAVNSKSKATTGGSGSRDIRKSRRAAEANVIISITAAAALLIVVNVLMYFLGEKKKVRWAMENLGRYSLSDSARRILEHVDGPVRLTSVYTAADDDSGGKDYAPRVGDLLEEMRQWKSDLTVVKVTSDRQKAQVLARLRDRLDADAADHRTVIAAFQQLVNLQMAQYEQMSAEWAHYPASGWLTQFGTAKKIEMLISGLKEGLRDAAAKCRQELAGTSLPDYPRLARRLRDELNTMHGTLTNIKAGLTDLAKLPQEADRLRAALTKDAETCIDEMAKALEALGKEGDPPPGNPGKVLDKFAAAIEKAAEAGRGALRKLNELNASDYARFTSAWRTPAGSLPQLYAVLSSAAGQLTAQAKGIRAAFKAEKQKEAIQEFRKAIPPAKLIERSRQAKAYLDQLLDELTKLDEATSKIFAAAAKDDYLEHLTKPISELLDQADDLKDLADQDELIRNTKEDNVVIVEVGEKIAVVPFEEVWPLAPRAWGSAGIGGDAEPERSFNGDMVVSSRILSLASEPFAEVVLTFYEDIPPPRMRQFRPSVVGSIPSMMLRTFRERVEKANLKVADWNLAQSSDPPENPDNLPRVLVILPPPMPRPVSPMGGPPPQGWSEDHEQAIAELIEAGTPAIFLAGFIPAPSYLSDAGQYLLAGYLKDEWGLDVKSSFRVIRATRDPDQPGKFKMPLPDWPYMPLSTFTEHPVGKPLRARRFYWWNACPILKSAADTPVAEVEEILTIPAGEEGFWAAAKPQELFERVMRRLPLEPDPDNDIMPAFPVVVEASRQIEGKQVRIIAIGVGDSYVDEYLSSPVPVLNPDRTIDFDPPPTGNVDLLINSVYHLADRGEFIGAGPAAVQRIRIERRTAGVMQIAFGVAWPAVIILVGAAVTVIRRR